MMFYYCDVNTLTLRISSTDLLLPAGSTCHDDEDEKEEEGDEEDGDGKLYDIGRDSEQSQMRQNLLMNEKEFALKI